MVMAVNLFGMISTEASREYTNLALRSFLARTPEEHVGGILLIDNDANYELPNDIPPDRVSVLRSEHPLGFAQNANRLLAQARAMGADLFLLNNDLVFTDGWLEPLLNDRRSLLSPMSNGQVTYTIGAWSTRPEMNMRDYEGHESDLEVVARNHREARSGYRIESTIAFYCIKIPRSVYGVVGDFDERFGKGGGEDRDYGVRAWLAGIPQEFAMASYVLHFQGKSTWRGPETREQVVARDREYLHAFEQKWGPALTYAFMRDDWNLFRSDPGLARHIESNELTPVVRRLRSRPSLDEFVARQRAARFGAVCCVYDDDSWLALAVESVYEACEAIWFLVSDTPWHGEPTDQAAIVERIKALPDPCGKHRIVRGRWLDEAAERNEGLRLVAEAGFEYCFVLDADEIYDTAQLQRVMTMVRETPHVDCWRLSCFTYWKSCRYRVDPPETIAAAVFVRCGTGRFVENRTYVAHRHVVVPMEIAVFHHMSYARSDEQVLRKISTFGHAREVVEGWYEDVWRKWDEDRSLENLNPCWPSAYRRVVEQPFSALPPVVQRKSMAEETA
jgi:GT2 family glycosyltransferase